MKGLSVLLVLAVAVVFSLSGCADKASPVETIQTDGVQMPALGKAEVVKTNIKFPVHWEVAPGDVPCLGEALTLDGVIHMTSHVVLDGNGGFHDSWHYNRQGITGVTESGLVYNQVGAGTIKTTLTGQVGQVYTYTEPLHFISRGNAPNINWSLTIRYVVNANGEVTVEFIRDVLTCK